ncbi:DUF3299 domain-containing protein [Halopseudomonas salina]|uniref:Lipoprotein n=1 Tax=Halopseudomonas salina TaxID=1323744 RepID=A0ABQ1Q4R1_9GAMM|nr:DUF3299 domain-containing protein [Halopseudomonas salina]GGD12081.1 hypothetical protein GCM10007418_33860 [Halopseudomonas salina]
MRYLAAFTAVCALSLGALPAIAVEELSWGDLVPPDALGLGDMQQPTHDLSSLADTLSEEEFGDPAVQMQPSAPVVATLDGREVKLPGYIVPLGINADGTVSEFLLVPYFGACIHVPPPPSNQIVHVQSAKGIELAALYQPFWVTGAMQVEHVESDLANAGYRIADANVEPYSY